MTRTNAAVPSPAAPRTGLDPTTAMMWESFKALMQTFVATQQANMATSTRGARYFKDFKRYDPRIFNGTSEDPTVAEMWVLSMENIFRLMNCPDDRKVSFASFMLQGDAELWWEFTREILSPNGGVITWLEFREAFWAKYNSDEARLRKQQEFT